jgi:hypothetical protein
LSISIITLYGNLNPCKTQYIYNYMGKVTKKYDHKEHLSYDKYNIHQESNLPTIKNSICNNRLVAFVKSTVQINR